MAGGTGILFFMIQKRDKQCQQYKKETNFIFKYKNPYLETGKLKISRIFLEKMFQKRLLCRGEINLKLQKC